MTDIEIHKLPLRPTEIIDDFVNLFVYNYIRWRYGSSWRWYWLNWQQEKEILL